MTFTTNFSGTRHFLNGLYARLGIFHSVIFEVGNNTMDDITLRMLVLLNPKNMFLLWSLEDLFSSRNPIWFLQVATKYLEDS